MLKKILSAEQTRQADLHIITSEPILSIDLMERASNAFVSTIVNRISPDILIAIVSGTGNNGGDGFAIGRILQEKGFTVDFYLVGSFERLSADCRVNYERISGVSIIEHADDVSDFSQYDLLIDALFGSGLSWPILGLPAYIVDIINASAKLVFSVDLPSGMFCDDLPHSQSIVRSDLVVSFQRPKWSFFFPESSGYIGEWISVNIGLDESFIQQQTSDRYIIDADVSFLLKPRKRFSHKGTYGHALLIAGSYGMIGAAVLSAKACLRSGIGLLTVNIPQCGYNILQSTVPEAMCMADQAVTHINENIDYSRYSAVGIGPGLGTDIQTVRVITDLLKSVTVPLVIDADALNVISAYKELLNYLPENSILTPHPKEFARLVGQWEDSVERISKQKQFSTKYNCIVVFKDAYTSITDPEGCIYFNTSGNAGMATGGSGDVLTGIITGLLGQGYSPLHSALLAVFFHGTAGDNAACVLGQSALLASDIIDYLRVERL